MQRTFKHDEHPRTASVLPNVRDRLNSASSQFWVRDVGKGNDVKIVRSDFEKNVHMSPKTNKVAVTTRRSSCSRGGVYILEECLRNPCP